MNAQIDPLLTNISSINGVLGNSAPSSVVKPKTSFLSHLTDLMGKAMGAGAGLATSAALPGVAGLGLSQASDRAVQSLFGSLGTLASANTGQTSSIKIDADAWQSQAVNAGSAQSPLSQYQAAGAANSGFTPSLSFLA
ncbi:hypothetical protein G6658_03820 [Polynucleobacter paneuropaeus]|nr:hypothetical protein G6658_03820 [Polynucleobacter paneuropaeus]